MDKQFGWAGETWDFKGRATLAKAAKAAGPGGTPQRRYRTISVAEGRYDKHFAKQVEMLSSSPELWFVAPPSFRTVALRALTFRCCSRMGCSHEYFLAKRHRGYPFKAFRVLTDPSFAAVVADEPECMLDP